MKNRILAAIPVLLVFACLIIGIWLLASGIGGMIRQNELKEDYAAVEGNLSDYSLYSESGWRGRRYHSATYRLTYTYFVDNIPYTVSTDYGTGSVPALGTARTVYYDPANPENAVLGGPDSSAGKIFIGAFFTGGALIFILGFCYVMGWIPKTKIDIMDLIMGGVIAGFGAGALYFMEGSFHPFMLIPWLMIAAGTWLIIRGIFFPGKT